MSEGGEGPKNIVNIRPQDHLFSRKRGESLTEYKRRLTHYIRNLEATAAEWRKHTEDWAAGYESWHAEAVRLEGLRSQPRSDLPLPQSEASLRNARENAAAAFERHAWYASELKKTTADLERYRQFRKALDLQTKYSRKDRENQ